MLVRKFDHGHQIPKHLLGKRPVDRDKLAMVPRDGATRVAHEALFPIQDWESPEEQVMGVGVLFAALCLRCGIDPYDLHQMGMKVLTAPDEGDHVTGNSLQVLRDFIGARIMAKEVTIG